jgi:hypothetical protein
LGEDGLFLRFNINGLRNLRVSVKGRSQEAMGELAQEI